MIETITQLCWDKCMQYPGKSLSSREDACFQNCGRRFADVGEFLRRKLEEK